MHWTQVVLNGRNFLRSEEKLSLSLFCALITLGGCTHGQTPRAALEPRHVSQVRQDASEWPKCPGQVAEKSDTKHSVTLKWNASTSSSPAREIRYCVYRNTDKRVIRNAGKDLWIDVPPCNGCTLVNEDTDARKETFYVDSRVKDGNRYCYIAVAMEKGNRRFSEFSNPAEAYIPPLPSKVTHGFCEDKPPTSNTLKNRRAR